MRGFLHRPAIVDIALFTLLVLCLGRLWLMPLPSSFWVDEMATAFVVTHGAHDPTLSVAPQVPASIYYVLPRIATRWLGSSEIAYRLPSVLALAAALLLIALLARRLIHPDAGWFEAFACLALRGFDYQAADARPYALGTAVACAALWFLVRWLDSGRTLDAGLFALMAALLWRVHLMYWPFYAVFGIYAVVRIARGETRVRPLDAAAVFGLMAAALLPVAAEALALRREAAAHVISALPGARDLLDALKPGLVAVPAGAAALLGSALRWRRPSPKLSAPTVALILAWWLAVPVGLFAFSWLSGAGVFLGRYLSLALSGTAVAGTAATAIFLPARCWKPAAIALGAAVLISLGRWNIAWPPHHPSDWRAAAVALNRQAAPDTPVLCPSPFVEARPPVWRPGYPISSFLYSHLLVYPVSGRLYPFPFDDSPEVDDFALRLTPAALVPSRRFAIYGWERNVLFWRDWLRSRPELAGWHDRGLGNFGDVLVIVFEAPHAP